MRWFAIPAPPANDICVCIRTLCRQPDEYRVPVDELNCDLLSLSAHKLYAPKGAGALYVRRGVRLISQNVGGHQERERRAGTEAVPNIVAFGAAARIAREEMTERAEHVLGLA